MRLSVSVSAEFFVDDVEDGNTQQPAQSSCPGNRESSSAALADAERRGFGLTHASSGHVVCKDEGVGWRERDKRAGDEASPLLCAICSLS